MLLTRVKTFLKSALNGNETISADLREQFMEDCGAALDKQFAPRQEWRLRMSSVGQLPCKQHLAKDGIKEELEYDAFMRFIFGDMVEALAVCVMKAAGIPVEDEQKKVSLQVYDTKLDGLEITEGTPNLKMTIPSVMLCKDTATEKLTAHGSQGGLLSTSLPESGLSLPLLRTVVLKRRKLSP